MAIRWQRHKSPACRKVEQAVPAQTSEVRSDPKGARDQFWQNRQRICRSASRSSLVLSTAAISQKTPPCHGPNPTAPRHGHVSRRAPPAPPAPDRFHPGGAQKRTRSDHGSTLCSWFVLSNTASAEQDEYIMGTA